MFENLTNTLSVAWGQNTIGQYLAALITLALTFLVFKTAKSIILRWLKNKKGRWQKEKQAAIQAVEVIGWPLYLLVGLHLAGAWLTFGLWLNQALHWLTVIVITYYLIRALQALVDYGVDRVAVSRREKGEATSASAIRLLGRMVKGLLWVVGFIIILQNLGYNITALAAGLGIGGLAVAFALQNVLADIFASFSIYFDRPFEVGDFIIIGSDMGTVQHIGVKSTRLKTLQGQELVVSNKELTESRVHNYRKMDRRRIVFEFGVEYQTPQEKLVKIPKIVKEIIDQQALADIDRVHFKEFGPYSLNFEVVYYINDGDYTRYMDTQQSINLELKRVFEQEKIAFAFPRQDVFLVK